MYGSILDMHH